MAVFVYLDCFVDPAADFRSQAEAGSRSLPSARPKIAREEAVLQSQRALQEHHPDAAAAFTAWRSAPKAAASNGGAPLGSGGIGLDALERPMQGTAAHRCARYGCCALLLQEFKEVRAAVRALRARASAHCLTVDIGGVQAVQERVAADHGQRNRRQGKPAQCAL